MPKLEAGVIEELRKKIRLLSREAAIEVLLGIVNCMCGGVSVKSGEFCELIKYGVRYTEAKNGPGS
jgi:hypothetical protein